MPQGFARNPYKQLFHVLNDPLTDVCLPRQLCFRMYIVINQHHRKIRQADGRREHYVSNKLGRLALHWLSNAEGPDNVEMVSPPSFLRPFLHRLARNE